MSDTTTAKPVWTEAPFSIVWGEIGGREQRPRGWREVNGWVWDIWGIDQRDGKEWVVTHLPSGLRFAGSFRTHAAAEIWVTLVQGLIDWDAMTRESPPPAGLRQKEYALVRQANRLARKGLVSA